MRKTKEPLDIPEEDIQITKTITWLGLARIIEGMPEQQQKGHVTLMDADGEVYPATLWLSGESNDILDPGHLYVGLKEDS